MNIWVMLYLAEVVDKLFILSCFIIFFCVFSFVALLMAYLYSHDTEEEEVYIKIKNKVFKILCVAVLMVSIIPSANSIYMIVGSEYLSDSGLPQKAKLAIEKKLDEIIEGTK